MTYVMVVNVNVVVVIDVVVLVALLVIYFLLWLLVILFCLFFVDVSISCSNHILPSSTVMSNNLDDRVHRVLKKHVHSGGSRLLQLSNNRMQ